MLVDRKKRPESFGEISFSVPDIKTNKLNNELKVYFSEKKELPIIRINFLANCGSRFDPKNSRGLSNLLSMCIDEGAGKFNSLQLADEIELLGAQFSVGADSDLIVISLQVLTENFVPALKLFKSVITEPHLNEEDFNREKRKILVRLNQLKMEPDYVADISFEYFLLGNDCAYAFPVIGKEKDIQSIQHQLVRDFYSQKFTPLNSSFIIVGNIKPDSLYKTLNEEFSNWRNTQPDSRQDLLVKKTQKKIYLVNKPDSVQTEIRIGHLTTKRNQNDFFQKQILDLILGGQFSSRLNLNLREKHGYTYGVHSGFYYFKEAGYFSVSTSVDTENTTNALKEILSELKKIKGGITKEELDFAKSSLVKRFPANFETYRQIASNIGSKLLHNLPDDYFETYIQKINSLNSDGVNSIAQSAFNPDELITVLVGDKGKILNQLSKEDFGEVKSLEFDELFNHS